MVALRAMATASIWVTSEMHMMEVEATANDSAHVARDLQGSQTQGSTLTNPTVFGRDRDCSSNGHRKRFGNEWSEVGRETRQSKALETIAEKHPASPCA